MIAFDVYGTLLTSAAGELGVTERSDRAFRATTRRLGLPEELSGTVAELFHEIIHSTHERDRSTDRPYPEVEIREIWRAVTERLLDRHTIRELERIPLFWERIAIEHEIDANPVWLMPGAAETLAALTKRKVGLAIVSNAQFYTPLTIHALFGRSPEELGFCPCIWSFEVGAAKPSRIMFSRLLDLAGIGQPENILYVGNDMRNDVAAAAAVGIRTALFAGDGRSLRLREADAGIASVTPDAIITDLRQLTTIVDTDTHGSTQ